MVSLALPEKASDAPLREFWNNHCSKMELQSLYTTNAWTWIGDYKNVVLVQNRILP